MSDPISVEGKPLPKGTYGLHMIPTADTWTIIFSKAADSWGSYTYDQAEDALRVTVKPHPSEMQEALQYSFEDLKPESATVTMTWEKLAVPFRISVNDQETVLPYIRRQMRGFKQYSWGPPNEAAQYCLEKKIALPEALKWADLSIQAEERFENLATKADILKAMGKTDEAGKVWQHAMELATPVQLYTYARGLQTQKRDAEAMEIFKTVAQKSPQRPLRPHGAGADQVPCWRLPRGGGRSQRKPSPSLPTAPRKKRSRACSTSSTRNKTSTNNQHDPSSQSD